MSKKRATVLSLTAAGLISFVPLTAHAQETEAETQGPPAPADEQGATGAAGGNSGGNGQQEGREFGGIRLGVGISATYDLGNNDRVEEASVVNGIVRIEESSNVRARVMLEAHHFFLPQGKSPIFGVVNPTRTVETLEECDREKNGCANGYRTKIELEADPTKAMWGHGPFFALQPGTDEIIEAIGAGWMIGFRRDRTTTQSFNIGIGIVYDPKTQILGEDIVPNEALPDGETEVRFTEQQQAGALIVFSVAF